MDTVGVIQSITLFVLIFLSGFFSSAETALTTVSEVKMRTLAEEGNKKAALVLKILQKNSKMLSSILVGNNIVNISASAIATTLAMRINLSVGIATGALTFIILIVGEIVPKTWAMISAEKFALMYSRLIWGLMFLLTPVIFIIDIISQGILKLIGIDFKKKNTSITESELLTYVDVGHEDGVIESEEREIIYNVFDFSDALAKDIMIPRVNMVTVDVNDSYDDVMKVFRESMYTRLPVYQDDKDNIIGLINVKDFILTDDKSKFSVRNILREGLYVYEHKKTSDLMYELREKAMNMSFVLNEYGVTVGMITLEDLLEEIVGEIRDEYDGDEEKRIQQLSDNEYLIEASMNLDDVNDALETDLKSEDYDSIGGIIIEKLEQLPEDGDEVTLDGNIQLKVQGVHNNRIDKVLLTLPDNDEEEEEENKDTDSEDINE